MKAVFLSAAAMGLFGAGMAQAHHSGAMYDGAKTLSLSGTVRVFQWSNPHSWLQVIVTDPSGGTKEWSVELAAPGVLTHRGMKPSVFKPGDKVTVVVHPMKDGQPAGNFVTATLADGTVVNIGAGSGGGAAPQPS